MKFIIFMLWCLTSSSKHSVVLCLNKSQLHQVIQTHGAVWPKPATQTNDNSSYLALKPSKFRFVVKGHDCDIIQEALRRYYSIVFGDTADIDYKLKDRKWSSEMKFSGFLKTLHINLTVPCEQYPNETMDEGYALTITAGNSENTGLLAAQSVWGILRGLETFSQIVKPIDIYKFAIHVMSIRDYPKYSHRGLLIDTSRHYLPVDTILRILDGMSYSKFNVLHWHILDDQSFPLQSVSFPSLSQQGSYDPYLAVYTHVDVKRIISYARFRGIRVIPELDSPGHTLSWGKGLPDLLTKCSSPVKEPYGPVDPSRDQVYRYLRTLIEEVFNLFPDSHIHLGGDEVDFSCWKSNEDIKKFMELNNITTYAQLEGYYMYKLLNMTRNLKATTIVWQEVFDNNVTMDQATIVHVWKERPAEELSKITKQGYKALLSSCWYLDRLEEYGGDWRKYYYACNPSNFSGSEFEKRLVIGGEACMWGEVVDETNIQQRIWPRACAAAEILWSGEPSSDAPERLEEHACRLKRRGIPAQPPNGPGYCPRYPL